MFENKGKVHFGNDVWIHTFQIKMPIKKGSTEIQLCKGKEICQKFNKLIIQLNNLQKQNVINLNQTVNIIKKLIPSGTHGLKTKGKAKSKRAILLFVGQLSNTLFGTATMDDVEILARHINALTTRTVTLTNAISKHDRHESTFMAAMDKRISNLVTQISDNHDEINLLQQSLNDKIVNAEEFFLQI